jgi:hypothetical protein
MVSFYLGAFGARGSDWVCGHLQARRDRRAARFRETTYTQNWFDN